MGELEGIKGAWGYVKGGMGGVSQAIANCAEDHGASIFVNKVRTITTLVPVDSLQTEFKFCFYVWTKHMSNKYHVH